METHNLYNPFFSAMALCRRCTPQRYCRRLRALWQLTHVSRGMLRLVLLAGGVHLTLPSSVRKPASLRFSGEALADSFDLHLVLRLLCCGCCAAPAVLRPWTPGQLVCMGR